VAAQHLTAAALYIGATVAFCYPVALHPLTQSFSSLGDGLLSFWDYWWAHKSLVELHTSPFRTTYLSYPHEASLVFHVLDLLHGILTIPLQSFIPGMPGLVLSVNAVGLFCFFFSAFTAYLAMLQFTRHWPSSVVGGFAYSFSAFHLTRPDVPGTVTAMYWLPLFTLLFTKVVRSRARRQWLLPGICFGLCTFESLYYALFLAILSVFLSAFVLLTGTDRAQVFRRVLSVYAGVLLCALPMLGLVVNDLKQTAYVITGTPESAPKNISDDCRNSIDVAGMIIPGVRQGLWRSHAESWNRYLRQPTCHFQLWGENGEGGRSVYAGLVPLVLACVALTFGPRRVTAPWGLCALTFIGFALGPNLHVAGTIYRQAWLPLPYRLFLIAPARVTNLLHIPYYFWPAALFAIWMLAAFGLSFIASTCRTQTASAFLWSLVLAWLLIDYASPPLPAWPVQVPAAYARIATDRRPVAILEVPTSDFIYLEYYSFLQTVHGRPIARGFLSRIGAPVRQRDAMIQRAVASPTDLAILLDDVGPSYVVVHKNFLRTPWERQLAAALEQRLRDSKVYSDEQMAVFTWLLPRDGNDFEPNAGSGQR
jgi:drug/metabolite transporter superfamily protein YnfA